MTLYTAPIFLTVVEKPRSDFSGGYKYLICTGTYAYCAFKTTAGFQAWLDRVGVGPRANGSAESHKSADVGRLDFFVIDVSIEERLFWSPEDIPAGATRYTDLSNGDLVDCYYLRANGTLTVWRPNPNAKDVYKPLALDQHIEYMRNLG